MLDEDNGEEWSLGNWHISPQESLNDSHRAVYDKGNETPVNYTKACGHVDSFILRMIDFDPERLTDNSTCCILGELLLSQDELVKDIGIIMNEHSKHQPTWTEEGVVDETDKVIRKLMYGKED